MTKTVRLYLNGSPHGHGNFLLIEHLSREYLISHFGHDNFIFYRTKGKKGKPASYREFERWVRKDSAITMREAKQFVDIDRFCLWWISHIFCANSDPYQGPAILDRSKPGAKWFWINWDMDHSIRNIYEKKIKNLWEQERPFSHVMMNTERKKDPRDILFRRLHHEDHVFRKYFEEILMNVLNHRLTQDFLKERLDYYERTAVNFGITNLSYIQKTRKFCKYRHAFVRKMMQRYYDSPESYSCLITGAKDTVYEIDGYVHKDRYKGWYFMGSTISVRVTDNSGKKILYWLINGKKYFSQNNRLVYTINSESHIKPVLRN